MARNKRLKLTPAFGRGSGGTWDVVDRESGEKYATLYRQSDGAGYRFRLENYAHRMSKFFGNEAQALSAIEREVF